MRTLPIFAAASLALSLSLFACGGDDGAPPGDGDGGTIDAPPGTIDAPMGTSSLGRPCTGTGQGTCPSGFECINPTGTTASWCSKACANQADEVCEDGYSGPGFPGCYLSLTPAGGGTARSFCLVFCEDLPGGPLVCPNGQAQCNGACPGPLQCRKDLTNTQGQVVAKVCY